MKSISDKKENRELISEIEKLKEMLDENRELKQLVDELVEHKDMMSGKYLELETDFWRLAQISEKRETENKELKQKLETEIEIMGEQLEIHDELKDEIDELTRTKALIDDTFSEMQIANRNLKADNKNQQLIIEELREQVKTQKKTIELKDKVVDKLSTRICELLNEKG